MDNKKRWITTEEAAAMLDVDRETVRAWCRKREAGEPSPIRSFKRLHEGSVGGGGKLMVSWREMFRMLQRAKI